MVLTVISTIKTPPVANDRIQIKEYILGFVPLGMNVVSGFLGSEDQRCVKETKICHPQKLPLGHTNYFELQAMKLQTQKMSPFFLKKKGRK